MFKQPNQPEVDYIKRVVGLPGDHIVVRHDDVGRRAAPERRVGYRSLAFDARTADGGVLHDAAGIALLQLVHVKQAQAGRAVVVVVDHERPRDASARGGELGHAVQITSRPHLRRGFVVRPSTHVVGDDHDVVAIIGVLEEEADTEMLEQATDERQVGLGELDDELA